ncbi:NUDIX hydrolase [Candidatus Uhrbacteria bacterium]|nr:NUDIX hydrolase [Candidatus Uhrbacteria bacterium]
MKKWKTLSTKVVKKNPWWEYRLDRFELPSGKKGRFHYMHTPGVAFIVAVDAEGRVAWINNYRYLFQKVGLELPGGGVKPADTFRQTAAAELKEETGLTARHLKKIRDFYSNNGLSDEKAQVFLATGLTQEEATFTETEQISLCWLTVLEADRAITTNRVKDSLTIAAWALARPHVLKLIKKR